MNNSQGALYFGAGVDLQQWRANMAEMRKDILGLSTQTQAQTQQMNTSFRNIGMGLGAYFSGAALGGFVNQIINIRGEFQKTEIAFGTMLKSTDKAKDLMGQMVELAAKTPFSLQDVSQGAKQLLAFQVPAEEVVDTLTRMGNIAAGLGVPLGRINLVYGQVMAKGKLAGDDLRQFTEAGIPLLAELAKKFGTSTAEISKMVSAGKIGFKDVKDVLFSLTNEGGMFFNLMEKQSKSLSGQMSNLSDSWDQMLNKIGESNEGIFNDAIAAATYLVENYETVIQVIGTMVAAYGTYRAALIAVSALQSAAVWTGYAVEALQFVKSLNAATRAQLLFNIASNANPYILLATGIAAVVGALVYFNTGSKEAKESAEQLTLELEYQKRVSDSVKNSFEKTAEKTVTAINKEIAVLKSSYSTLEMRKGAYTALIALNKSFTGTVDAEYRATNRLGDAYTTLITRLKELSIAKGKAALLEELSRDKAKADLDLMIKGDAYEKQRLENLKKQAENNKKNLGSYTVAGSGMGVGGGYSPTDSDQRYNYSAYNPKKEAEKEAKKVEKQFQFLSDDIAKSALKAKQAGDKEVEKAFLGVADTAAGLAAGSWKKTLEDKIAALDAQIDSAPTAAIAAKLSAQKRELEKQLKDTLNPAEAKNDEVEKIYGADTLKGLQQRISQFNEIMETSVYGSEKYNSAKSQKEILEKQLKAMTQGFDEQLAEVERQWENYYKLSEFYGKEVADAQYQELIKGSNSYLAYLEKEQEALQSKTGILSEEDKKALIFITEKINGMTGAKTPLQNWKDDIAESLRGVASLSEQIKILEDKDIEIFTAEGGNTANYLAFKRENDAQIEATRTQIKDNYQSFLDEHQSFEERKLAITQKYDELRSSASNGNERSIIDKAQADELSKLALELFKSSADWQMAFADMEFVSQSALKRIEAGLLEFKRVKGDTLQPTEIRELEEALKRVRDAQNTNPFTALIGSIKKLIQAKDEVYFATERYNASVKYSGKESEAATQASKELAEADMKQAAAKREIFNNIQKGQNLFNAIGDGLMDLGDAFGGFDDATNDAIGNIMAIGNAAFDLGKSIASGDVAGMIKAGVQLIGSIAKALNGDQKKERNIKKQAAVLKQLETAYNDLAFAAERAFGSMKYSGQRDLIRNLEQQKVLLQGMLATEASKKKADKEKMAGYQSQIQQINQSILQIKEGIVKDVLQTDVVDAASKVGDALVDAFGRGEDAVKSLEKTADDMIKNLLRNQLNLALQSKMKPILDSLLAASGFNADGTGAFQALSPEQIAAFKAQVVSAGQSMQSFLEGYSEIFGGLDPNVEGLKGDIKGMTEKTAGALEAQINAMRINQVAGLEVVRNSLLQLVAIEFNTRRLHNIDRSLEEMNGKMKKSLAGIP